MSNQATLRVRISQSKDLSDEAVRAFIVQNKARFSNSTTFGPTSKLRVDGKNSKTSSQKTMRLLLAAQRLEPENPVYLNALKATGLGMNIVEEGSSVLGIINESTQEPRSEASLVPPGPTLAHEAGPSMAQENAIRDLQGQVAQDNEVVAVTNEIIKDVTQQITKDMGKPVYETDPNRGVGTEAMQTEKVGNNTFDQKVDSLGSVSEVPAAQNTKDSANASSDQIKATIQTPFAEVQDPELAGPVNILQQDTSNEGTFAEGSEQIDVVEVGDDEQSGTMIFNLEGEEITNLRGIEDGETVVVRSVLDGEITDITTQVFDGKIDPSLGDVFDETPIIEQTLQPQTEKQTSTRTFPIKDSQGKIIDQTLQPQTQQGAPEPVLDAEGNVIQDPVVPAGSAAGIQSSPEGYQAMYPIPLAIYFGSSSNPLWDSSLTSSILGLVGNKQLSPEQMLTETQCLHEQYKCDLFIPTLKVTSASDTSAVMRQYLEVVQLWSSLKRNLAQGKRIPSVGIPLSDLQQFGSLLSPSEGADLANSTATPSAEAQPVTPITQQEKVVEDAIQPSNTTKSILQGATPLSKSKYWRGEPRGSIAMTQQLDGLRRASINRGANGKYGRSGSLVVPDDIRQPRLRTLVRQNNNPEGSLRMGLQTKTDNVNNRIRL